ncbi:MAG: membrane-bound O-acyltransferase family protein [Anaerolineaceae bacterium]|nr:membrane-bound O-acyltransferase family protein [Anaerolineaceae bacterium]
MSFISPEYVLFFSLVVPLYFAIGHRWRWLWLLLTSYVFYAYGNIAYLPIIIFSTLVDFVAGRQIARTEQVGIRRLWLIASLGINLGVLFFFKYFNFFSESVSTVTGSDPIWLDVVLPVGISFYTFQSMSYTIDIFRRQLQPEPSLGRYAAYVAMFPQLVAGPIERASNLLPQMHVRHQFDVDRAVSGLQVMLWGFFKKVVIADRLAVYVNAVYNDVGSYSGAPLILATLFFAVQIYCDFSGYSDIAIGTARVMGFDLMENFRQPYFSRSVGEFWRRWHISLSSWFRDYVYIPLGGNRVSLSRHVVNVLIVFLLSGLWHGAAWTFVIWGGLHGLMVAIQTLFQRRGWWIFPRGAVGSIVTWLLTLAFICVTWVFFRANSLDDAIYVLTHVAQPYAKDVMAPFADGLLGTSTEFWLSWVLIGLLFAADGLLANSSLSLLMSRIAWVPRWVLYYVLAAAVIFSGLYGTGAAQFIYFQF